MKVFVVLVNNANEYGADRFGGLFDRQDKAARAAEDFVARKQGEKIHWRGSVVSNDSYSRSASILEETVQ